MLYTEYSQTPEYKIVKSLLAAIGVTVKYEDTDMAVAHVDDDFDEDGNYWVSMPINSGRYGNMTRVLAHELAHFLIENAFYDKDGRASHLIEYCCDQIGNGVFLLAEKIVEESEANNDKVSDRIVGCVKQELS
jgi:hypothetical protein